MNVLKALKVAELRKKLGAIPAKIIISGVFLFAATYWFVVGSFSEFFKEAQINKTVSAIKAEPLRYFFLFVVIYGIVSFFHNAMVLMRSKVIGIILGLGFGFLVVTQVSKLGDQPLKIALIAMILIGPLGDIVNLIRYSTMKNEVIRAEEEQQGANYNYGFDDGFERGYVEGNRNAFNRIRQEDEAEEEEWFEQRRRHRARLRADWEDEERYERMPGRGMNRIEQNSDDYNEEDQEYYEDSYEDSFEDSYEDSQEDYQEEYRKKPALSESNMGFFTDCRDVAAIRRRYKDLCKVYHPDSGNGSEAIFYKISDEYEYLMNSYGE